MDCEDFDGEDFDCEDFDGEDFDCEDFDCEDFDCEDFDLIQTTTCAHCTGTNFDKFCETCKISYLSDRCRSPTRSLLALNNTLQITKCTKCEKEVLLTSDFMGLCNNCLAIQKPVNPFIGTTQSERTASQDAFDYYTGKSEKWLIKWPIHTNEYKLQQQVKAFCSTLT
jgi:hypothetical protein